MIFIASVLEITRNLQKKKVFFQISELLRCSANEICKSHFHMRCLSKHALNADNKYRVLLFPVQGQCPKCGITYLWGELIREQRILLAINKFNSSGALFNMIPSGKLIKI